MARCLLKRIARDDARFLLVTLITFLVVLPLLVGPWPHSLYYRLGSGYFGQLRAHVEQDDDPVSRRESEREVDDGTAHRFGRRADEPASVWLLVTIVTVRREGHFYLGRVLRRLSALLMADRQLRDAVRVLVCNADREPGRHGEALRWSRLFPMVQRNESSGGGGGGGGGWAMRFENEKQDYVFCLRASRRQVAFEHVVVLEDDAVPLDDMFDALRYLTWYLSQRHPAYLYAKLYHPPRLQGYVQPEPWRIAEWLGASALAALVVSSRFRRPVCWLAFFMLLFECVGRPHLLEFKRHLGVPFGYNVLYATECCTPGMLFSNASLIRAINFFESITCQPGYAKDTALYRYYRQSGERAFVIEPNLVEHIGLSSTLR